MYRFIFLDGLLLSTATTTLSSQRMYLSYNLAVSCLCYCYRPPSYNHQGREAGGRASTALPGNPDPESVYTTIVSSRYENEILPTTAPKSHLLMRYWALLLVFWLPGVFVDLQETKFLQTVPIPDHGAAIHIQSLDNVLDA